MKSAKSVCPFCALHCDDLQVDNAGEVDVQCSIARRSYPVAMNPPQPRVGNENVSYSDATAQARLSIKNGPPVVLTSFTSLAAAKRLEEYHADGLIRWVFEESASRNSIRRAISRDGMIGATLADVRRHADCVWVLGNRDNQVLPRMGELGEQLSTGATQILWPHGARPHAIGDLLDAIRQKEPPPDPETAEIYRCIRMTNYFAVICCDDAFDEVEADAASSLLIELISYLNASDREGAASERSRRAVLVTFDSAQTSRCVALWRRNEGIRRHERQSDGDSPLIRIGDSFGDASPVAVQVGGRDPGSQKAAVYIPVATEGIHRADMVVRGDGAVTLPLGQIAESELPTASEWLSELLSTYSEPVRSKKENR